MIRESSKRSYALGIECGGTQTTAVRVSTAGKARFKQKYAAANLQLTSDAGLRELFWQIADRWSDPAAVGLGFAGLRTEVDQNRVRRQVCYVWPASRVYVTDDLETVLAGVPVDGAKPTTRVLVLSGTGSCCLGLSPGDRRVKVGGWGHFLGDEAGGYGIGLAGIRAILRETDRSGSSSWLLRTLLKQLDLTSPDHLIGWCQKASKADMGAVAPLIFSAWKRNHPGCGHVIAQAVNRLVDDAIACMERLPSSAAAQFVLSGGCLSQQRRFREIVSSQLKQQVPGCEVLLAGSVGAQGAGLLAWRYGKLVSDKTDSRWEESGRKMLPMSAAMAPTERRHPKSMNLDQLSIREGIELMAAEDKRLPAAIIDQSAAIERAVRWVTKSLRAGGRLIYCGAGTSGRLGVLDASECPPTFRTEPKQIQGFMAGGDAALRRSIEGAEDSISAGHRSVQDVGVSDNDVVMGITASGRTPFVWGSLLAAKTAGAKTILLCFNPHLKFARGAKPCLVICPEIGPEVLTGSTRLKSGTATKMILNMITTLSMVRLGKVIQNLMVDLNPSNVKLRDRAIRIVVELTGCSRKVALEALAAEDWRVKKAYRRLRSSAPKKARQQSRISVARQSGPRNVPVRPRAPTRGSR
ncbi:MAG: N-acetylmuramic acid 6-phosphate etherase [Verrucomicrobia subdivision 3 bacterium]|nr:N-acetylmuramic acid 6-phosphate etherase [Limisphaerales bacterium]MCS1417223.1 N-acetylmuramic acid 6-phosphate etherase [Limisphaerales bacterium]